MYRQSKSLSVINSADIYAYSISCTMDAFVNGTANGTYRSDYLNKQHRQQQELYEIVFVAIMLFLSSLTAALLEFHRRASAREFRVNT